MIFDVNMACFEWFKVGIIGLVWFDDLIKIPKEHPNRKAERKPEVYCSYKEQYGFICRYQNWVKLILDKTRL